MNEAFSITESIVTIAISAFISLAVFSSVLFFLGGLNKLEIKSLLVKQKASFFEKVTLHVLNPDTYPHRPDDEYILEQKNILFFANKQKIEYKYDAGKFEIFEDSASQKYDFIKDFTIKYFDNNGCLIEDTKSRYPLYCELWFTLNDTKEITLTMKL